jgi:hypothetical protein
MASLPPQNLTQQWPGPITSLASDLSLAHQKYKLYGTAQLAYITNLLSNHNGNAIAFVDSQHSSEDLQDGFSHRL